MLTLYLSVIDNHDNDDDFLKIYNEYKYKMLKVIKSYISDEQYAENALQSAFVGIAKNIDTVKRLSDEKKKIYIFKAAKNSALNVIRDEMPNNTVPFNKRHLFTPSYDDVEKKAIQNDTLNRVLQIIRDMDEKYRDVLSLRLLCNLSFKEISIALGVPVTTVKDRYNKGIEIVNAFFKENDNDKFSN